MGVEEQWDEGAEDIGPGGEGEWEAWVSVTGEGEGHGGFSIPPPRPGPLPAPTCCCPHPSPHLLLFSNVFIMSRLRALRRATPSGAATMRSSTRQQSTVETVLRRGRSPTSCTGGELEGVMGLGQQHQGVRMME